MPEGTETGGQPFSMAAFPHVDGVMNAFDDPAVRTIVLQWGTRLGKTTTCLCLMAKQAATNPRNMMFSSSTKDAAGRVIESRLYPLLESTDIVRRQLLPESRRSKLAVKLKACRIFVAWSGSKTSLADVGAFFGVGNEIDKWDSSESDEADPLALFLNRFKGFTNHKIILESTPTIRKRSRIESWLHRSNQHRRYCPCPHCGEFQILRKGEKDVPGGIKWETNAQGESDPEIAFNTAYYECEHCHGRIENYHRVPMLRAGKWVPNGCTIDKSGAIHGTAHKQNSDIVGFGPLPSWYALTETWGSFPRLFLRAKKRPRDLQDVVNSYMAETWETKPTKTTPERVAERIGGKHEAGLVPIGGQFLTVTVDRQAADGGFVVWCVMAHGLEDRSWEICTGMAATLDEIWDTVMRGQYQHADGGNPLVPIAVGIDSGWATKDTYGFCQKHPGVIPLKGSGNDLAGAPYRLSTIKDGAAKDVAQDGQLLLYVNTDYWETDLQSCLDDKLAGEPGSITLSATSAKDIEFMEQLCNGTLKDATDTRGNAKLLWVKKEESVPNEVRDIIRYGRCLARAWIDQNGGVMPSRSVINTRQKTVVYRGDTRPDGREW